MTLLDIVALALIQGITEFLPVSSQGHVFLAETLMGVPGDGASPHPLFSQNRTKCRSPANCATG